jgi:hypothetical protein
LTWESESGGGTTGGEWIVARICSEYLQYCEQGLVKGTISMGHRNNSAAWPTHNRQLTTLARIVNRSPLSNTAGNLARPQSPQMASEREQSLPKPPGDDEHATSFHTGFYSIVVPHYARRVQAIADCAVFEFDGSTFDALEAGELAKDSRPAAHRGTTP